MSYLCSCHAPSNVEEWADINADNITAILDFMPERVLAVNSANDGHTHY
jgi:hypothetical protein